MRRYELVTAAAPVRARTVIPTDGRGLAAPVAPPDVAALFARKDSIYKTISRVDVWDAERDARGYRGPFPVVAHPPCRGWGRFRHWAKPIPGELMLGHLAIGAVRKWGGVLEHPEFSTLWDAGDLPRPGNRVRDEFGGFTFPVLQHWWGHRARKGTWLYIVGLEPRELPELPYSLNVPTHVINSSKRRGRRGLGCSQKLRESTPPEFALWLVTLARMCRHP